MISWRRGTVVSLGREWRGALELEVDVAGTATAALAHPDLVGRPEVGDLVLLNVTALELGLGTGGYALVVAFPDRLVSARVGVAYIGYANTAHAVGQSFDLGLSGWMINSVLEVRL